MPRAYARGAACRVRGLHGRGNARFYRRGEARRGADPTSGIYPMGVIAFEGPAGCGKTHRLMDELGAALHARPLAPHQQVLALTYMHGARRRLDTRLRAIAGLAGRFEAMTLDSFAWRLTQRWRRLAESLGHEVPGDHDYARTCALAAILLARPVVQAWVEM